MILDWSYDYQDDIVSLQVIPKQQQNLRTQLMGWITPLSPPLRLFSQGLDHHHIITTTTTTTITTTSPTVAGCLRTLTQMATPTPPAPTTTITTTTMTTTWTLTKLTKRSLAEYADTTGKSQEKNQQNAWKTRHRELLLPCKQASKQVIRLSLWRRFSAIWWSS